MSLVDYKQALRDGVEAWVPSNVSVTEHAGDFATSEIQRYANKAPCVIIVPHCVKPITTAGTTVQMPVGHDIYVMTKHVVPDSRSYAALLLVDLLIRRLAFFTPTDTSTPAEITAENLYSGGIDGMGLALWCVHLRQVYRAIGIRGDGPVVWEDLDNFITFNAQYPIVGSIEADDPETGTPITETTQTLPSADE